MRIDNRFFTRVIIISGVFGMILIAWFTFSMRKDQYVDFQKEWTGSKDWNKSFVRMVGSNDSTRLQNINKPMVIYFWSGWSDLSIKGLSDLVAIMPNDEVILAPIVKDDEDDAVSRISTEISNRVNFSFGTFWYLEKKVPAIPTTVYIDSAGVIQLIKVGYEDSTLVKEHLKNIGIYARFPQK